MTENGWQAIGRIAKARRERLGLNQDELAQYGGPRVATVGKFERAAQETFPLRTQHQIEKALGWSRGIIEQVVESIEQGELTPETWEHDLIFEDVPDMSLPVTLDEQHADAFDDALSALRYIFKLVDPARREEALRLAIGAMLPLVTVPDAAQLGRDLRVAFPPRGGDGDGEAAPTKADLELAAHDEAHSIEDEQGHDETP